MDDTISRQAAITAVLELDVSNRVSWKDAVIDTLDALQSAQPRKKGRWINGKCSECGEPKPISKIFDRGELVWDRETHINYCNNCGAEMEKGEE